MPEFPTPDSEPTQFPTQAVVSPIPASFCQGWGKVAILKSKGGQGQQFVECCGYCWDMQGLSRDEAELGRQRSKQEGRGGGRRRVVSGRSQVQSQPFLHHLIPVQNVKSKTEACLSKEEDITYL